MTIKTSVPPECNIASKININAAYISASAASNYDLAEQIRKSRSSK